MGGAAMFFAMASLGLPGLGNFVGEVLVLLGAFKANPAIACVATVGLVFATVYSLWIIYRVFHGESGRIAGVSPARSEGILPSPSTAGIPMYIGTVLAGETPAILRDPSAEPAPISDLRAGEIVIMLILVAALLWLGLFPQAVIDTAGTSLGPIQSRVDATRNPPEEPPVMPFARPVPFASPAPIMGTGTADSAEPAPVFSEGGGR